MTKIHLVILLFLWSGSLSAVLLFERVTVKLKGTTYQLEIADNLAKRRQGLMYRNRLSENEGMIFVYPQSGDYRIWMKNTLIPLTVMWLDENAIIIDIKLLHPCRTMNCPIYRSGRPSRYIIELHPSAANHFTLGDRFSQLVGQF